MDKVAFGREGELFVLKKLFEHLWEIDFGDCKGVDLIVSKFNLKRKIQVKRIGNNKTFNLNGNKNAE